MSAGKVMQCMQYSEGVLLDSQPLASKCLRCIIEPVWFYIEKKGRLYKEMPLCLQGGARFHLSWAYIACFSCDI